MKIYFVIDESGAKGYSDKNESKIGDFGIITGFIFPEDFSVKIRADLDVIKSRFITTKKTHITDLSSKEQDELRKSIYDYFANNQIHWLCEAIYVKGFYEKEKEFKDRIQQISKPLDSKVRIPSVQKKENLLSVMFQGVCAKVLAFCKDNFEPPFELVVITDRQDKKN